MDNVTLKPGKYSLRDELGRGDSGPRLHPVNDTGVMEGGHGQIVVGLGVKCGSINGRSYANQDWWQTSPVAEILEIADDKSMVKFKTESGSVYTAKTL